MNLDSPPAGPIELQAPIHRLGTYLVVCIVLFLVVVMATLAGMVFFTPDSSSTYKRVAQFSGSDDGVTGTFVVDDEWEFRWTHDGIIDAISWTDSNGKTGKLTEMPGKPIRYSGGIDLIQGGEYFIRVKGNADWTIDVFQF